MGRDCSTGSKSAIAGCKNTNLNCMYVFKVFQVASTECTPNDAYSCFQVPIRGAPGDDQSWIYGSSRVWCIQCDLHCTSTDSQKPKFTGNLIFNLQEGLGALPMLTLLLLMEGCLEAGNRLWQISNRFWLQHWYWWYWRRELLVSIVHES